jgi:hypothetical protein
MNVGMLYAFKLISPVDLLLYILLWVLGSSKAFVVGGGVIEYSALNLYFEVVNTSFGLVHYHFTTPICNSTEIK